MKHAKRILAVFLTLALALSFALPTTAAVDWNEFIITKQPLGHGIQHGNRLTLSVEVAVPAGVEVEYQWYRQLESGEDAPIEGANKPTLNLSPSDSDYPPESACYYYRSSNIIGILCYDKTNIRYGISFIKRLLY